MDDPRTSSDEDAEADFRRRLEMEMEMLSMIENRRRRSLEKAMSMMENRRRLWLQNKPDSPSPSCVSMKSEVSIDPPPNISDGNPSFIREPSSSSDSDIPEGLPIMSAMSLPRSFRYRNHRRTRILWQRTFHLPADRQSVESDQPKLLRNGSPRLDGVPGIVGKAQEVDGIQVDEFILQLIGLRYTEPDMTVSFPGFLFLLMKLDSMMRKFQSFDMTGMGMISVNCRQFLHMTMYN